MLYFRKFRLPLSTLLGGSFRRNVLKVASGTVIGQGLFFLASPLLTRLYDPADFGVFSVYSAILSIVLIGASLRYEIAIPVARTPDDAFSLSVLATVSLLFCCLITCLVSFLFFSLLKSLVGGTEAKVFCWLFPASVLGGGVYKILNFYAIRTQDYGAIAKTRIFQCVSQLIIQLGGGLLRLGLSGLVLGDALGRIAGVRCLAQAVWKVISDGPWAGRLTGMREAAIRYWTYPVLSTPSAVINMAALQLPAILLTFWYGPAIAGFFSFSQMILGAPATLISQAVAQVFTGEIARHGIDSPTLLALYRTTAKKLLYLGLIPATPWVLGGSWLVPFIFGEKWGTAGVYVQLLSLSFLAQFVAVPISQVLIYLNRQGTVLLWDIVRILLTLACLGLPQLFGEGDVIAMVSFSAMMIVCYGVLYLLGLSAVKIAGQQLLTRPHSGKAKLTSPIIT